MFLITLNMSQGPIWLPDNVRFPMQLQMTKLYPIAWV